MLDIADERLDAIDEMLEAIDDLLDAITARLDTIDDLLDAITALLDTTDDLLDEFDELLLKDASLEAGALDAITVADEAAGLIFASPPPPPQAIINVDVLITAVRSKYRRTTSGR